MQGTIEKMSPADLSYLADRQVLVVAAHADDPVLFCGGTIALMARAGALVTLVRVTNDDTDSADLSPELTIERNSLELRNCADLLGIGHIIDLGYPSDHMWQVPETVLREQLIRIVRQVRPYAVLTLDPHSGGAEDNQDHVRTAQAMDEAFWTSMFDKHHPEHAADGLSPHGVVERWYFGRPVSRVTDVVDISSVVTVKADAAACHITMLGNLIRQLHLMARTDGRYLPDIDVIEPELPELIRMMVTAGSASVGDRYGCVGAEEFRRVRFSGLEVMVDLLVNRYEQKGDQ